jgi:ABC-type siderophore export system fused ATPase/permease subunit
MNLTTILLVLSIAGNFYLGMKMFQKKSEISILEDYLFQAFESFIKDELKGALERLKKMKKEEEG